MNAFTRLSKDDLDVSLNTSSAGPQGPQSPRSTASDHCMNDLRKAGGDLSDLDDSLIPQIQSNPPTAEAISRVAPWQTTDVPTASNATSTSFYHDDSDNISAASHPSPAQQEAFGRQPSRSACHEQSNYDDARRPSVASITTASSQGSKTSAARGGLRKLQGFFGEEFPGRDSSESSLPNSLAKDQQARSLSNSCATERGRNYSNASVHTGEPSPSSSRPRTPIPAPEVVPFLYQDNTVRDFFLLDLSFSQQVHEWHVRYGGDSKVLPTLITMYRSNLVIS